MKSIINKKLKGIAGVLIQRLNKAYENKCLFILIVLPHNKETADYISNGTPDTNVQLLRGTADKIESEAFTRAENEKNEKLNESEPSTDTENVH